MNNLNQILTTAFLTVISGASVFCLGQIVLKFFIEVAEWKGKRIKKVMDHGFFG
jgi:hypothetical protein